MARNIALTLTLGGTEQSISSINELEAALRTAKEELAGLEIGSESFRKLSQEIQDADTKLKQLNDNAKGLKIDRTLNNVLQTGRLVANSFAAATAALGLFGIKSETLTQAQTRALQALTIATTIADIAQQKKNITDLTGTIRTAALTAATNAQTLATRTFFTVVAANPLGALVTAIGLVVTALISFTSNTETATTTNDDFNKSLQKTQDLNNQNIALLQAQGKDEITIQKERLAGAQRLAEQASDEFIRLKQLNAFSKETNEARIAAEKAAGQVVVEEETLKRLERERTARLEKELEDARKERDQERIKRLEEELRIRNELLKRTLEEQRSILAATLEVQKVSAGDADIVKRLKERLNTLMGIKKGLESFIPIQDEVNSRFKEFNSAIPGDKALSAFLELFDVVDAVFDELRKPPAETRQELNQLLNAINELAQAPTLSVFLDETARKNLVASTQGIKTLAFVINELQNAGVNISPDFIEGIVELRNELDQPFINPQREQEIRESLSKIEKDFVAYYVKLKQSEQEYQDAVKTGNQDTLNILTTGFAETARLYLKAGVEGLIQFRLLQEGVFAVQREVIVLQSEIQKLTGIELADYLLKNREIITKAFEIDTSRIQVNREKVDEITKEVQNRTFDQTRKYFTDVLNLEIAFSAAGIDITKLTYEQKLVLLQTFLNQELTDEETQTEKINEQYNKRLESYANGIREFQGILNNIQQTLNDFYDFQFDKLESRNKQLQAQIVGDSLQANQKRIDIEKQYQAEKTRLEKRAAKSTLRISLLQATANVAESITAALRTGIPVVSQLAAAANAAIGAIQVGIITSQLAGIDSLQRGGKVKMRKGQGGMVVGPSHEYGGVRFGQRGLELEGGEAVINRMSSLKYGDLLSEINMAGGGRPIVNNNFDDSRLLEALAKQRSEPIRAYVVEADITNKQTIARRLDQLSQV